MRRPRRHVAEAASIVRARYDVELENVEIDAADGITLNAWYVRPHDANGRDVLMLHGVADNREGVAGFASTFLDHGYAVLLPDSRAHGESGGAMATYGLRETDDIHRWVDWLNVRKQSKCVYSLAKADVHAAIIC